MKRRIMCLFLVLFMLCACKGTPPETNVSTESACISSQSESISLSSVSESESDPYTLKPQTLPYQETVPGTDYVEKFENIKYFTQELPSDGTYITVEGEYDMPPITNDIPLEKLIPVLDDKAYLVGINLENCSGSPYRTIMKYHPCNITEYAKIPVAFLRNSHDGRYYTVVKIAGGGYAYFFFERIKRLNEDGELAYVTEDLTKVTEIGCLYAEKVLQKSDFDVLKIGDTIEDVIAIDNAAVVTKQWNDMLVAREMESPHHASVSVHLLTDGLLTIEYTHKGTVYTIKSITYSEDFIFNSPFIEPEYPKDYSILPQDYPPET